MEKIETGHLTVRNFMETDGDDLFKTLSDEAVMKYIEPPFDMEKTKEFIREAGLLHGRTDLPKSGA